MKKVIYLLTILFSQTALAQNVPSYVPTNGLVGWWPFSGNAIDSSGNGNNGTVNGATLTTDRFGNANRAYAFNGLNQNITKSNFSVNNGSLSFTFWFNASTVSNTMRIITHNWNDPQSSFSSHLDQQSLNYGYLGAVTRDLNNSLNHVWSSNTLNNNTWYFVAVTISGSINRLYVNGSLINSINTSSFISSINTLFFGGDNTYPFNGKLDDIGIWNRALTLCEIQALYTGAPSFFNTNLIAQDTIKACGDSVLISATSSLSTYAWNTGATISSIYAKNTGWYKVTGTNASGCSATDSVFVSIVKANILNNDTTVCVGTALTLNAQTTSLGTACASSGLPTNLQTGLVGYWPFCGNANDMSGNGNNGTVNGATLTADRFGNANSAYSFNGINNVINVPSSSSLIIPNNISISAWVYRNSSSNVNPEGIFGPATYLPTNAGYFLRVINNKLNLSISQPYTGAFSNLSISGGQWFFVLASYDNNYISTYINGHLDSKVLIGSGFLDVWSSSNPLTIGQEIDYASPSYLHPWNGKLDDIAIWNRALSPSEVSQLYQTSSYAPTYLWSTGATTPSINVTPSQTTKYWVQVSNGISSCTDTVTITVQNPSAPTTSNIAYCQGATATALTATSAAASSLRWYTTATGGTFTTIAPIPNTNTVGTTTYYVSQITPIGCESARAALTVTINPLPQATISANKAPVICTGDSVVYTVSPAIAGQTYTWYKNGVVIAGATGTSYAAKQSGVYSVQVFNSFGCSTTSANSSLSVYPWPTVNAGPDKEVPAGTSVDIITQTTNAQSIAWSPVTGLSCISCASPTATVNFPIVYVVTVTSAGGCSVSDTIAIRLVCEDNLLYLPNTFTPNGDGENDRFYPMGKGLGDVKVFRIVNRLGQVVYTKTNFSANDASYGWDGTFNGADLGMDVYSYYIEVNCATGQVLKRTGDISLLR